MPEGNLIGRVRSLLFVPAEERRLRKIGRTEADAYIIDLEDSIAAEGKGDALARTAAFLESCEADFSRLFVRVNRDRCAEELAVLKRFPVGAVLPKFRAGGDYAAVSDILFERKVIALIEDPQGLIRAGEIASVPFVGALAFGAEDFTAAANMRNSWENLSYPKSVISVAAKAYGKKAFDTPCFHIGDETLLLSELKQARDLGFDGKLAIHPSQPGAINAAFSLRDREYAERVIGIYERSGRAVCEIDGTVYEKLHIDRMKKMLASENEDEGGKRGD